MTAAEEANLWARIVALEEKVADLIESREGEVEQPAPLPEPPRDRYGDAVGRPGM